MHADSLTAKGVLGRMARALTSQTQPFKSNVYSITGNHKILEGGGLHAVVAAVDPIHFGVLQKNVDLEVIRKVPEGHPTKWCSRMVTTKKKSGKLRLTVDLTKVNDCTYRELHHQK